MTAAYEKMQEVASYINERKRESDNINKILEIESKLKGLNEVSPLLKLYVTRRHSPIQGVVLLKKATCRAFIMKKEKKLKKDFSSFSMTSLSSQSM